MKGAKSPSPVGLLPHHYQAPLPFNSNSNSSTTSSCNSPTSSSLVLALRKFYKSLTLTDDLNTLVIQYIAATGDLPILSCQELTQLPKPPKFGMHINKMSGFVKAAANNDMSNSQMKILKMKQKGNNRPGSACASPTLGNCTDESSEEDELTVTAWKEDFMHHYGCEIKTHDNKFKAVVEKVTHCRKIWKSVQSVLEKKTTKYY